MNKRIRKAQVIKMLEEEGFDRIHTLHKTRENRNGDPRRGWFIATLYGWKYLGDTLAEVASYLELRKDEREHLAAQKARQ